MMTGQPLAGVRVLDFSTLLPGPMASLMLAESGAEVVKVERPGYGEELRLYEPRWGREGVNFSVLNRGKKSIAIDLKDARNIKLMEPLIRDVDIIIEQFRPGVMQRLGLGYEAVRTINPKIIYCSITGYGATGPKTSVAGHDLNYIGDTGILSLSMGTAEHPVVPPVLIADLAGGTYPAVVNILLALLQREKTGEGTHLDIAMTDNMFMLSYWASAIGNAKKTWPKSGRELLTGGSPRYQIYPTKDGEFVAAAPLEQKFWQRFCELIELPEEFRDDQKDPEKTISAVAKLIEHKPSRHWHRVFYGEDCCCSIVADLKRAVNDPHFVQRGLFDHKIANENGEQLPALSVAVVPQFRDDPAKPKSAPALGSHNDEFLKGSS